MLYITSPGLIYFKLEVCTFWPPSPIFAAPAPPLATTNLVSASMNLVFCFVLFLDSTYKWDHMVFVFLWLTYFTQYNALKVHPCCLNWQDFILFMSE